MGSVGRVAGHPPAPARGRTRARGWGPTCGHVGCVWAVWKAWQGFTPSARKKLGVREGVDGRESGPAMGSGAGGAEGRGKREDLASAQKRRAGHGQGIGRQQRRGQGGPGLHTKRNELNNTRLSEPPPFHDYPVAPLLSLHEIRSAVLVARFSDISCLASPLRPHPTPYAPHLCVC
eukprot:351473-Chlamydomonas_euryale.AAC.3